MTQRSWSDLFMESQRRFEATLREGPQPSALEPKEPVGQDDNPPYVLPDSEFRVVSDDHLEITQALQACVLHVRKGYTKQDKIAARHWAGRAGELAAQLSLPDLSAPIVYDDEAVANSWGADLSFLGVPIKKCDDDTLIPKD